LHRSFANAQGLGYFDLAHVVDGFAPASSDQSLALVRITLASIDAQTHTPQNPGGVLYAQGLLHHLRAGRLPSATALPRRDGKVVAPSGRTAWRLSDVRRRLRTSSAGSGYDAVVRALAVRFLSST
jgi:hypothetical protein